MKFFKVFQKQQLEYDLVEKRRLTVDEARKRMKEESHDE